MRTKSKNSSGFTLIEVLFALAILTSGLILLGTSWSGNLMRVRKSNLYSNVSSLLERKIIELESEYKDKPLNEIPESREGDFGDENEMQNYSWKMKSRDLKFPDLAPVIVGKDGADENLLMMIRQMTDILGKSVKEIKVSVIVKTPKKALEFSATDYMIDYNTGLTSLPGGGGGAPGAPGGAPTAGGQPPGRVGGGM